MDFDTFYETSWDRIHRAMVLTFRDPSLAEEITQEAFFRALKKWSKVSLLDHPEGWTMIVALNKGRDIQRRRSRRSAKQSSLMKPEQDTPAWTHVEERMMVSSLLAGLTDRQRQALLLRYVSQLSIREISVVMKCAEGTVKATIHSALANASQIAKESLDVID